MPPRSFFIRLVLPFAALLACVVIACGILVYIAGERTVRQQQMRDLDRLVQLVRDELPTTIDVPSPQQSQQILRLATLLDARITLIDGLGKVLLDTHHDPQTMANHNDRPEILDARKTGVGSSVRQSDTINEPAVYVAQRLNSTDANGMIVRLSYPHRAWVDSDTPIWPIVFAAACATIALAMIPAWIVQSKWIGPVRSLAGAAQEIAAGSWETRVLPSGADEVEQLGTRFNDMAREAQKRLADLTHQRADLQALVDSLPDPILLSDASEKISILNAPAARLLQLAPPQAIGKTVGVVVNEASILSVIEQARAADAPFAKEIRLLRGGQRVTYHALATPAKAGGVLLVLRNVSAMAATVQMKTDFVANASHELRTPIAAIKIAFETLQDVYREDAQQTDRCMHIIDSQLRRLEEMLTDLLDLSRVENPELKADIAPVSPADLIATLRATMQPVARGKNVELYFSGDVSADPFQSDARLLNLTLKNLVENSIKFTPPGGAITIDFTRENSQMILRVRDSGIGISLEHQQRVFERFYQVDPARSGSAGRGTGLGLAIVKHAMHALGGTVELQSDVGRGTTVICAVPVG